MRTQLDLLLGQVYRADVLKQSDPALPKRLLREALEADQEMRAEASRRLVTLNATNKRRQGKDFLTARYLEFLTEALEERVDG